ncbi:hypothetical protein [Sphingorhabdus sp.]|jgi:hypothetical protein|uniref:hypothetical protein n=3 Tax=Sphingorhabdus sp. TaxID=1902408 RepID=UPI003BB1FD60|nr:hypothetical protein [Sphingomonadales bacterium]MBK9433337.1 hypothetical protein [Sphingomonadales bacterium]MBL0022660.1 hypothetical protein [Sphingomonadales bacterium]
MAFFRDISPRRAGKDLLSVLRDGQRNSPLILIAACLPAMIMVVTFYMDAKAKSKPPPPQVLYIESWPASRTIEESKAAIMKRQAERDAFNEKKRENYKALGRMMGMDVEEIEREAERIRNESKAAADAAGEKAASKSAAGAGK